jgi:hypothetical protein
LVSCAKENLAILFFNPVFRFARQRKLCNLSGASVPFKSIWVPQKNSKRRKLAFCCFYSFSHFSG